MSKLLKLSARTIEIAIRLFIECYTALGGREKDPKALILVSILLSVKVSLKVRRGHSFLFRYIRRGAG